MERGKNHTVGGVIVMPLKLRPTGLGSGAYQDKIDYNVFSGEWLIGRIYERNGFPDEVRFFWCRRWRGKRAGPKRTPGGFP